MQKQQLGKIMPTQITPVLVAAPEGKPLVVETIVPPPTANMQVQRNDPSVPATTTFQEDLTTAGQRKINLIWEYTQAIIALLVVISTMICGIYAMIHPTIEQIPTIISVAFGTVVGFYFSRTNHAAIGGIGAKPEAQYMGR